MIYTREEIYFPSEDMKKMIKEVGEEIKNIIKGIKKEKKIKFYFYLFIKKNEQINKSKIERRQEKQRTAMGFNQAATSQYL